MYIEDITIDSATGALRDGAWQKYDLEGWLRDELARLVNPVETPDCDGFEIRCVRCGHVIFTQSAKWAVDEMYEHLLGGCKV